MKKTIVFFLISIYSCTNHCMDTPKSMWSRTISFLESFTSDKSSKIWITTNDGQITEYNENICSQSTLLLEKIRLNNKGSNKENPIIDVPLSKEQLVLFARAIYTPIEKFDKISPEKKYLLLAIANTLKSRYLYALLIHKLLPADIDKKIRKLYFSHDDIKDGMIKHSTPLTSIMYSYFLHPIIKAQFTDSGDYYLLEILSMSRSADIIANYTVRATATQKLIKELNNYDIVQLSPKNNCVALARTRELPFILELYDIDTDTIISLPAQGAISSIALSPDGNYIAVALKNSIHLWNIHDKNRITKKNLVGHTKTIRALAFNEQSTLLISGSNNEENCILWDISDYNNITKQIILTNRHHHFDSFIFSTNNNNILCGRVNSTPLYFSKENQDWSYHCIPKEYSFVTLLKQDPHYPFGASCLANDKLYLWSTNEEPTRTPLLILRDTHPIKDVKFSNSGHFVSRSTCNFIIWNHCGKSIKTITCAETTPLFATLSPNGQHFLCVKKSGISNINVTIHRFVDEKIIKEMDKSLITMQGLLLQDMRTTNKPLIIQDKSLQAQTWKLFKPSHQKLLQ
ncbi:MAG TPA: hypothetical protein VJJ26_04475 [Candidatus Babeliales bacterium]|nr:hypothetical protein [Candidatus Babeliales bacterium]